MNDSSVTGPPALDEPPPSTGERLIRPLTDFFRAEASAGVLLVAAAVVAMVWANSPWSDSYFDLWSHGRPWSGSAST